MLIDIRKTEEESRWLRGGAWLVLLLGLTLSVGAWWRASDNLQKAADTSFVQQGAAVPLGTPEAFGKFIEAESARYGDIIQRAGIKLE